MAIIYKNEYLTKLQERLSENTLWKEICKVEYTDVQVIHNPYLTDVTANSGTRGTGYTPEAVETTDDTITINTYYIAAQYIDRADLAQKTFAGMMDLADNQGIVLDERLVTAMLAEHAQFTNFDNASIGGAARNITVSESNIDDLIRGMKREIIEAHGEKLSNRNGMFIVWRAADFEKLEAYANAQGFNTADDSLKNGIKNGFKYLGVEHYVSNFHTANHLFGGVKKVFHCGICKSTYGKMYETVDPVVGGAQISGIGINSRIDYAFKAWNNVTAVLFDILVA
ncbi:hypothetical protein GQ568_02650 [Patescibacteria group bacterium]|nr:hypothetical protein [Patescibacteria group bacterium]